MSSPITLLAGNVTIYDASSVIGEDITITSGSLTADADSLGGVVANAASDLILTGGTVANDVTGAGTTTVTGAVDNAASIANDIVVASGAALTTATSGLTTTNTITNNGTLTFNDTVDGVIGADISGATGTVEIAAADGKTIDLNGKTIAANELKLTSGNFYAGTAGGNVDLDTNIGSVVANGGTLDVQDGAMGTISLGTVDLSSADLNVAIDADFTTGAVGTADVLDATSVSGSNNIAVTNVLFAGDPIETNFSAQVATGAAIGAVDMTNTTISGISGSVGDLLITYDNVSGYMTGEHSD